MTLNKHKIQGLPEFKCQTLSATRFEQLMIDAGYSTSGTAPAQGNRILLLVTYFDFFCLPT